MRFVSPFLFSPLTTTIAATNSLYLFLIDLKSSPFLLALTLVVLKRNEVWSLFDYLRRGSRLYCAIVMCSKVLTSTWSRFCKLFQCDWTTHGELFNRETLWFETPDWLNTEITRSLISMSKHFLFLQTREFFLCAFLHQRNCWKKNIFVVSVLPIPSYDINTGIRVFVTSCWLHTHAYIICERRSMLSIFHSST